MKSTVGVLIDVTIAQGTILRSLYAYDMLTSKKERKWGNHKAAIVGLRVMHDSSC